MGSFYVTYTFCHDRGSAVAAKLDADGYRAFVAGPIDGFVVVAEEQSADQDDDTIETFGKYLSTAFQQSVACFLNHDDDELLLWIFSDGAIATRYDSSDGATNGIAQALTSLTGASAATADVEHVLTASREVYVFEGDRHLELCRLLNLPRLTVDFSFESAQELYIDQVDPDLDSPPFTIYPANPPTDLE